MAVGSEVTRLLPNRVLAKIERLRLELGHRFTNRSMGHRLRGRGGNSTEFADFRDYAPGDDLRFVDWNIFSRLRRPYVKIFQVEEEQHLLVLLDRSASMEFDGKDATARRIAAALVCLGLRGDERVSVHAFGDPGDAGFSPPVRGRANLARTFTYLEGLEAAGTETLEEGAVRALTHHRGKGMAVVISDFMCEGDSEKAFARLYNAGLTVNAVQVLAPVEIDPDVTGDLRFVDRETDETLDISSVGELLELYHRARRGYSRLVESWATKRGGRFLLVDSTEDIEDVVCSRLRRAGWMR